MTLETLGGSKSPATTKTRRNSQECPQHSLHELAGLCVPLEWFNMYKSRLDKMRLYKQHKYHNDEAYRNTIIHANNARTKVKRQDPEYRAHEAALQRKCRQNAKQLAQQA